MSEHITLNTELLKSTIGHQISKLRAFQHAGEFLHEIEKADAYLAQQKRAGEQSAKLADAAKAAADKRIDDAHKAMVEAEADAANKIAATAAQADATIADIYAHVAEFQRQSDAEIDAAKEQLANINGQISSGNDVIAKLNADIATLVAQRDALTAALTSVKANLA